MLGSSGFHNKWRLLAGFLTVPGMLTCSGLLLAVVVLGIDYVAHLHSDLLPIPWPMVSGETARQFLTMVGSASMAALSLVYSTVLVVFTLAAGNIAPRLLQRFSQDRTSQIAVGMLGATFLYCVVMLWGLIDLPVPQVAVAIAVMLALLSVLLLLIFIDRAAKRVTVDEEIASIGAMLEEELERALRHKAAGPQGEVVLPDGPDHAVSANKAGYIDQIDYLGLAQTAEQRGVMVDWLAMPGDFIVGGQRLGRILGAQGEEGEAIEAELRRHVRVHRSRNPTGDLRFSVGLLVEIALRALSPGVNDTFTAIACIDRLSSALMPARKEGLPFGTYADANGALRVVASAVTVDGLIREAFDPIRTTCRDNMLMVSRLIDALGRLGLGKDRPGEAEIRRQLDLIRAELRQSSLIPSDRQALEAKIAAVLRDWVGQPEP